MEKNYCGSYKGIPIYIESDDKIEKIIITKNFLKWSMNCEKHKEEMNETMYIINDFRQYTNINFATLNINTRRKIK